MAEIRFRLNVIPRGQARVRHAVRNGRSIAYKTADQQADEQTLEALMMPYVPKICLSGAIDLRIAAYLPIPKSKPKKWQNRALQGEVYPTTKPDADNVAKNITDCLVRMRFLEDDRQIVHLSCSKLYSDSPGYEILLRELEERK